MDALAVAAGLFASFLVPARCVACDERVPFGVAFCGGCVASIDGAPPTPEGVVAAFTYGGPVAEAIARLKYGGRPDVAGPLGRRLATVARGRPSDPPPELVVPVPLHPRRLVERGFNQAALLARPVGRALGVVVAPRALARVRDTPRQARLTRVERLGNVRAAFAARDPPAVSGRRVLLVDDVATTGSTLRACRAALLHAGAVEVRAAVVAIAGADEATVDAPSNRTVDSR